MPTTISVNTCRKCAGYFKIPDLNGGYVTVLCGKPRGVEYKAISYVWGITQLLRLICTSCNYVSEIPMESEEKLQRILKFAGTGSGIWLDAISIDQNDPADVATQMATMGEIFRSALRVSVFLPPSDREFYDLLRELCLISDAITKRSTELQYSVPFPDRGDIVSEKYRKVPVFNLVEGYFDALGQMAMSLSRWKYYERAWTLQEWAMASELEVSWDGAGEEKLENFKNLIFEACVVATEYTKRFAFTTPSPITDDAQRHVCAKVIIAESVGRHLTDAKALFPFEDFPIAEDEIPASDLRLQAQLTTLSIDHGTHVNLRNTSPIVQFRMRLGIALNVLSRTKRKARYEADLVACWASMCNIKYAYDRSDSREEALRKVIFAIREQGVPIFNFAVNTTGAEIDLKFEEYATAHSQSNGIAQPNFLGVPIFTGRADTTRHFAALLDQPLTLIKLDRTAGVSIKLRKVQGAHVVSITPVTKIQAVLNSLRSVVVGPVDASITQDILVNIKDVLSNIHHQVLERCGLLVVSIPIEDEQLLTTFYAWSIIPLHLTDAMFIARESLNGTIVAAYNSGQDTRIASYLAMTHQMRGTFLIKTDESGIADMVFHPNTVSGLTGIDVPFDIRLPLTPGLPVTLQRFTTYNPSSLGDQFFNVKVPLQTSEIAIV